MPTPAPDKVRRSDKLQIWRVYKYWARSNDLKREINQAHGKYIIIRNRDKTKVQIHIWMNKSLGLMHWNIMWNVSYDLDNTWHYPFRNKDTMKPRFWIYDTYRVCPLVTTIWSLGRMHNNITASVYPSMGSSLHGRRPIRIPQCHLYIITLFVPMACYPWHIANLARLA